MEALELTTVYEAIGVIGFILYVGNYALLTFNKLNSEDAMYFILNWVAATCVLIGLMSSFNLASALIQVFWIAISSWGIFIRFSRRSGTADRTALPNVGAS